METKFPWRVFWILWGMGVAANTSFLALVRIPATPFARLLLSRIELKGPLLIGCEVLETAIVFAIVVGFGLFVAHRAGLGAPILESCLRRERVGPALRALLLPSIAVGILVGVFRMLPDLSVFHPNRELEIHEAEKIYHSEAGAKLLKKLDKFTGPPLTPVTLSLSFLSNAISGELIWRLFLLSVMAWIVTKLSGTPASAASPRLLWIAILAVAAISALYSLERHWADEKMVESLFQGLQIPRDPFWLVATRGLLTAIPTAIGFGWLYVRRGIESAILGALVAHVAEYLLVVLVLVHFV